ncbi:MAG: Fic family protein [Bacteroidota bacterium]
MLNKYYDGTPLIIKLSVEVGKLLGAIDAGNLRKPKTKLRRENKIKTIHSSLMIEGNTLSLEQVSDIIDNKRVFGPSKDILEVKNAIVVYEKLNEFDAFEEKSYLEAHRILMKGLIGQAGQYRTRGVGIFKGDKVAHLAPPAWNVSNLMNGLFEYLKKGEDGIIVKSCVFHYEMEFIHPFMDGNGRMGRLWQTKILMRENPVFEYLPIEAEILKSQQRYYDVLGQCDREGVSTKFIEYMLEIIQISLRELIGKQRASLSEKERLEYFINYFEGTAFARKDYLKMFTNISGATASRDLKYGIEIGILEKYGEKRNTTYRIKKHDND